MPRAPKRAQSSKGTNTSHLVLSTGEAHPPFIQEIPGQPGEVEKCVWDDSINGYRCRIISADDA
jgi:hypothetical protein